MKMSLGNLVYTVITKYTKAFVKCQILIYFIKVYAATKY